MTKKDNIRSWHDTDKPKKKRSTINGLADTLRKQGRTSLAVDLLLANEALAVLSGKLKRWADVAVNGSGGSSLGQVRGEGHSDLPKGSRAVLSIEAVSQQLQAILKENGG